jgi:hypothetical protein
VPGIPYNIVMKMMLMGKRQDLQITAILSYDRSLIFFTVTNSDSGCRKLHNEELHNVHSYTTKYTETNTTKFASKTKYPQFAHRIKAKLMSNNKNIYIYIYIFLSENKASLCTLKI